MSLQNLCKCEARLAEMIVQAKAQDVIREVHIQANRVPEGIRAVPVESSQVDVKIFDFPGPGRRVGNNSR